MHPIVSILTADPNLGRVDYGSFSDQTLMEMFFEGFDEETKRRRQDTERVYLDVCKSKGVECDREARVIKLTMSKCKSGSLQLRHLPPKFQCLLMSYGGLTGSIDLAALPQGMQVLTVASNKLTGSVDLAHLPQNLRYLGLVFNRFEGSIDLTQLPQGMKCLYLNNNRFSGCFNATHLPSNLGIIYATGNQFSATAFVDTQTEAKITLNHCGVTSVVDENGSPKLKGVSL